MYPGPFTATASCAALLESGWGHSRRLSNVGMSASPLTPDVGLRRSEPTLRAKRRHRCQVNCAKIYAQALLILTLKSYRRCGRRRHDGRSLIWQLDQLRFEASGEWPTIAPHRPDQVAEHHREIAALACTAAVPFEIQKPIPEVIVTRLPHSQSEWRSQIVPSPLKAPATGAFLFCSPPKPGYRGSRRSSCFVLSIDHDLKRSSND